MNQHSAPSPTNFFSSLDWIMIKKYASKIISVGLLLNGLRGFATAVVETFKYTQAVQTGAALDQAEFQMLLRIFLTEGIGAFVETGYGLILLFKPTQAVKLIHLVVGSLLFILPYLIPNTLLDQLQRFLPQANSTSPRVLAQETSPPQALSDYQFQLQKYREAHKAYLSAKNAFLSFHTLNSRAAVIEATQTLMSRRAETLRSYLFTLRINLLATPAIPASQKTQLLNQLQNYETNLGNHLKKIPSLTAFDTISQVSSDLETSYPEIQLLSYQTLLTILKAQQTQIASALDLNRQELKFLLSSASQTELNLTQINQWLDDIQTTLEQNQHQQAEIDQLAAKLKPQASASNQRSFQKILTLLDQSRNQLLTVVSFLEETLKLIRYG